MKSDKEYNLQDNHNAPQVEEYLSNIEAFTRRIRFLVQNIDDFSLNISVGKNEVSLKQLIHACADLAINSYVRLKLILTETGPVLYYYKEEEWSLLPDYKAVPVEAALTLIENIHLKLSVLLKNLKKNDLIKKYSDPSINRPLTLNEFLEKYTSDCNRNIIKIIQAKIYLRERSEKAQKEPVVCES